MQLPETDGRRFTVLIVDDHELVADALERALGAEQDLHVVGRAGTVAAALASARSHPPDVVVMDYRLPDGTGTSAAEQIRREFPETEIVMLTGYSDGATLAAALEAGCSGFVAKSGSFDELVVAIRAVVAGEVKVPQRLLGDLAAHLRPRAPQLGSDLSPRELEVLGRLAAGESTAHITNALSLSVHTVRNHVRNILAKLQANSRLEAVAVATRLELVRTGPLR